MSEPTPSIEQLRECVTMLAQTFDDPGMEEFAPDIQLNRALDELATLRARVAEQEAWRAEREANSDPDVNAARHALRSLTVFTPQTGTDTTPVNLSETGDRIAVVIEAYVDQILWRAQAEGVLRRLTDDEDIRDADQGVCVFCWKQQHKAECPVLAARTLLGEGGRALGEGGERLKPQWTLEVWNTFFDHQIDADAIFAAARAGDMEARQHLANILDIIARDERGQP